MGRLIGCTCQPNDIDPCPTCEGAICIDCDGYGVVPDAPYAPKHWQADVECPACGGTGVAA